MGVTALIARVGKGSDVEVMAVCDVGALIGGNEVRVGRISMVGVARGLP